MEKFKVPEFHFENTTSPNDHIYSTYRLLNIFADNITAHITIYTPHRKYVIYDELLRLLILSNSCSFQRTSWQEVNEYVEMLSLAVEII